MVFMSSAIFSHRALALTSNQLFALESRIATLERRFEWDLVLYLLFCTCVVCEGSEDGPRGRPPILISTKAKLCTSIRCLFSFCLLC